MSRDKDHQIFLAKLAEQTERYDEMIEAMRKACEISGELSMDERNLLSVGYKNVIGTRRASWRILYSIEQKEQFKGNESHLKMIQNYRITVEEELTKVCDDIIDLIDKHLLPAATDGEASVFYHKMKGDYFRYLAEFKVDSERQKAADESMKGYETASELAKAELLPTHPIRLGLALNYSVFYYEILNNIEMACTLAKIAFDEAISELDSLSEESYKDSTLIMQLLRDNLTLWTSELPDDDDDDDDDDDGGKNAPTDDDDGCAK